MTYSKIASIQTQSAKGNPVTFELWERDATEADPMPKFPVYGYRLRFNLSQFGFGVLNSALTLDIVDDESGTYFNKFNAVRRTDYAVRLTISGNELFWGFIDFQQLRRKIFPNGSNGITITAYNPLSWLNSVPATSAQAFEAVGSFIQPSQFSEGEIHFSIPTHIRIGRLLTDFAFGLFNNQPDFIVEELFQSDTPFNSNLETLEANIINAGYFDFQRFLNQDNESETLLSITASVLRSFFCRCGYSYTQQKPMVARVQNFIGDFYRYTDTKPVLPDGLGGNYAIINNVAHYQIIGSAVIERAKILRGATFQGVTPLSTITYTQQENIVGSDPSANVTIDEKQLILNVDGVDAIEGDKFVSDALAFSATSAGTNKKLFIIGESGGLPIVDSPETFGGLLLEGVLARIHEVNRGVPRLNASFTYDGILDPMRNYQTDFDANTYIITRGEYDVLREQTTIIDSISI